MANKALGKGDKPTMKDAGSLGLSSNERFDKNMPLRGETGVDKGMRPTAKTEKVSSDRGGFKSKC